MRLQIVDFKSAFDPRGCGHDVEFQRDDQSDKGRGRGAGLQSFSAKLADENLTGSADVKSVARSVLTTMVFNGTILQKTQPLIYSAKTGKTGSAK
jgi:hypothetical protein